MELGKRICRSNCNWGTWDSNQGAGRSQGTRAVTEIMPLGKSKGP